MAEWTKDQIIARIRGEADRQKVDPDLAVAVATQESYLNPNARGDNGNSLGLFQLQPAAALDVGVNPAWRHEPGVNIYGGVSYLKQKLQQSKGNVEDALRRYNGGGDPNYVQNVMRFFKPGVAEASERPQAGTYTDTDVHNALQALQAPQEPAGGTYTDEDVQNALKALEGTQPPAGATTTPAPVSTTATTPAPAGGTLEPSAAEARHAEQTLAAMRQRQAQSALQGLAVGGGPTATPQPVTDPAALLAVGGAGAPRPQTREQQILAAARERQRQQGTPSVPLPPGVPTVEQETLQETLTAPETLIPLAIGGVGGAVGRAAGTALRPYVAPWLGRAAGALPTLSEAAGNYASRWLNVQLGYEEPGKVGDVVSVALPISQRVLGAGTRAVTRNLPGAGVVRHELGEQALEGLRTRLRPRTDADTLFAQAATHNPDIATADMWRTAGGIVRGEQRWGRALRATESRNVAQEVLDLARTHGGPVPLARLEELRQRVGALKGEATGRNRENLSNLYRSIMADLESAANRNVPGAEILRGALQTRRLEHGLDTLTDLWSPGKGIQLEQGDITRVYGRRIQNQFQKRLQDDPLFAGSFTPEEIADIQTTLRDVARLTARSPVAAPGGLMKHALSASLGTAMGMTSGPVTGVMVAAGVEAFPRMMAAAMRSPQGRAAIRRAFEEGGGQLTAAGYGMINQAIRDAAGGEPTTAMPPASPGPLR